MGRVGAAVVISELHLQWVGRSFVLGFSRVFCMFVCSLAFVFYISCLFRDRGLLSACLFLGLLFFVIY